MESRISNEAIIIVNGRVEEIVKEAANRAKLNSRKTIMPHDI
jgi:histone H3/H4